ncbi:MAG: sporulation protein YabP [Limnochordia bacterium]
MEDKKAASKNHQLRLINREALHLEGVIEVESFDEHEIILETDAGVLEIRGRDLHVRELNVDSGHLSVDGFVQALEYTADPGAKRRSLLGKLFK